AAIVWAPQAGQAPPIGAPILPRGGPGPVPPADSVLTTAASIAPVPDEVNGITSWPVWKSRLSPARTSMNRDSYSGVRWWMIGCAIASSTSDGTGVGPGAIK